MLSKTLRMKRLSLMLVLAMVFVSLLVAVPAFAAVSDFSLTGPVGVQQAGGTATFEATATGTDVRYQFWVRPASGSWGTEPAQNYSASNTFTMNDLQSGSYVVAAYAMEQADLDAGNWAAAQEFTYPVYVGSTCSLEAVYNAAANTIDLTASSTGIIDPVYQFWYQDSAGTWLQSGAYSQSATYSITNPTGTYKVIAYAKERVAREDFTQAIWSDAKQVAPQVGYNFVESTQMTMLMPGSYVAKITLKAGVTTDDVTATINGQAMTARSDKTGFYKEVTTASVEAVVTGASQTSVGSVAIPDGTLAGYVASTSVTTLMPGSYVAKVTLENGKTTDEVGASINGQAMTARADKTGFYKEITTATATADITAVTTVTDTVTIQ